MPEVTQHVKTTEVWTIELAEHERWVQPCRYSRREFTVDTVIVTYDSSTIDPTAPQDVSVRMSGRRKLKSGEYSKDLVAETYHPGSIVAGRLPSLLEDAVRSAGLALPS